CYTSTQSGNEIASWMAGNNYTYTATKEISTIGMSSDSNYNSNDNTYVKNYNGTDYTLYNYLYFIIPDYVKPTLDIISLKITRDDYVAYGTVEYIGEDGSVIKSETAQVGDYAVNFTPEVAAGDYFMGWYTDAQFTNEVTNCTVELTEAGIKLYSKWEYKGNWDTDLDKKYIFDLANMGYYSDIACKADGSGVQHDTTKPWVYGAISYNSGFGRGLRNVYPVQSIYSDKNWGPQAFLQPDTVQVDGKTVNSLKFTEINTGRFVPLKADGTPFELAPGHKYYISVKYYYRQDTSGTTLIEAYAGIPGEYYNETSYDSAKSTYGTVYTATRFEWLYDDEVGQVFETKNIVLDLTTLGDDENYDYDTNTYTVTYGDKEYTLYNYLNFGLTGGKSVVDFLELEIYRDDYTEVTDGQFNVGDVTNNTTYKVTFDYIVRNTIENNIGIGFKTTAADGIGYPTYIEGKDVAIYNIKTDAATSKQHTATTFITTDMYATVDAKYGDDDLIAANSKLFGYVIGSDENVSIFNIKVEKVTDSSGNNVVNVGGAQCLIESAEATVGSQALRFTFNYDTMTGNELYINGIAYTVKERGFIYLDGNNYALNGIYSGNINLANAKAGVFVFDSKTDNFSRCWTATQIGDTELYNIGFSTYIKKFLIDDTREMMVRGFVVIEVDGQLLTIYSNTISRSVEYVKNGGGANYDPTVRRQVWGYDFSEISSLTDVADFHQNNNRNNFSANEYRNPVVGGDNYVLEDGVLKLKITYSDTETTGSVYDMPITLSTKDKMSYKYGYLELEAELPFERGIHQGFWLAPQNEFIGSGSYEKINDEIDIFEVDGIYNADQPKYSSILTNNGVVAFNLHKWYHYYDESGNQMTSTVNIGSLRYSDVLTITKDLFDEFTVTDKPSTDDSKYVFSDLTEARKLHRYGFEWTEEYVAVYIDPVVVNGTPVSEPYFKVNISGDNDFYNAAEGHENTVGMDCFHEEQYIILSFCPILSNTYAYGNEYNNATVHDIIDLAKERQGGESLEFKIHSIKLYQKAGESINFH
ncbi:MAG: hypothetical protein U0M42_01535, partial [Acutalibacteraceae bacterium]|nr:hypothetical protein [Acutalibacteraceae bacterium]